MNSMIAEVEREREGAFFSEERVEQVSALGDKSLKRLLRVRATRGAV